jgi:hypothetical protein
LERRRAKTEQQPHREFEAVNKRVLALPESVATGDDDAMPTQLRHCNRVMDDPSAPECLRFFLRAARGPHLGALPPLFATLKRDFSGRLLAPVPLKKGQRVRITDAGRFGDIGVTTDLDEPMKYLARASVDELESFSETR